MGRRIRSDDIEKETRAAVGEFSPWHLLIVAIVFVRIFKAEVKGMQDDSAKSESAPAAPVALPAASATPAAAVPVAPAEVAAPAAAPAPTGDAAPR
jgi:hypothetical protein